MFLLKVLRVQEAIEDGRESDPRKESKKRVESKYS